MLSGAEDFDPAELSGLSIRSPGEEDSQPGRGPWTVLLDAAGPWLFAATFTDGSSAAEVTTQVPTAGDLTLSVAPTVPTAGDSVTVAGNVSDLTGALSLVVTDPGGTAQTLPGPGSWSVPVLTAGDWMLPARLEGEQAEQVSTTLSVQTALAAVAPHTPPTDTPNQDHTLFHRLR